MRRPRAGRPAGGPGWRVLESLPCGRGLVAAARAARSLLPRGGRARESPARAVLLLPDLAVLALGCLDAPSLRRLAGCARAERAASDADAVWREACRLLWRDKQQSAFMRRWLAERGAFGGGGVEGLEEEGPRSWKERYAFALRDRHRCRILREELCEDVPLDAKTGRPHPLRWHLRVRFERWQDKELVFRHQNEDTPDSFSFLTFVETVFAEVPWAPHADSPPDAAAAPGMHMLRIPSVRFPLRVGRRPDWGWTLRPANSQPDEEEEVMIMTSRQLSAEEHQRASEVPPELITLCLEPVRSCLPLGVDGTWRVARAFQGTMPAGTWIGAQISFVFSDGERGNCEMVFGSEEGRFPSMFVISVGFYSEAGSEMKREGHMDLYMETSLQPARWIRGPPLTQGVPPLMLVVDFARFFSGESLLGQPRGRPGGPPSGVAGLEEAWALLAAGGPAREVSEAFEATSDEGAENLESP